MNVSKPLTVITNFATSDHHVQNQPLAPPDLIIQQFGQASMPHQQMDNNSVLCPDESSIRQIQPVTYPIQHNVAVDHTSQSNNQPQVPTILQQQRIVGEHPPSNFVLSSSQQKDSQSVSPQLDSSQYSESQQGQKPQQGDPQTGIYRAGIYRVVDQRIGESNPILPPMLDLGIPNQNFSCQQPLPQLPISSKQSVPLDTHEQASSYQVSQSSNENVEAFIQQSSHVRSNSVDSEEKKAKDCSQQLSHQNDFNTLLSKLARGSVSQPVIDSHAALLNQQMQSQVFDYGNAQMQAVADGPNLWPENIFIQPAQPNQNVISPCDNVPSSLSQTEPAFCQTSILQQLNNPLQNQSFLPPEKSVDQTFFQQQQAQQYQTQLHPTRQGQTHQAQNSQQQLVQQQLQKQQLQPLPIQENFDVVLPQQSQSLLSQLVHLQSQLVHLQSQLVHLQSQFLHLQSQFPHLLLQLLQTQHLSQEPVQHLTQHSVQQFPQQPQQLVSQLQLQQHSQQAQQEQAQQVLTQQTQQIPQQQSQQLSQQHAQQVPHQQAPQLPQKVPQLPTPQLPQQQTEQLLHQQAQQLSQTNFDVISPQQSSQLMQQQGTTQGRTSPLTQSYLPETKMAKVEVKSEGCSDGESTTTCLQDVYYGSDGATEVPIAWYELQMKELEMETNVQKIVQERQLLFQEKQQLLQEKQQLLQEKQQLLQEKQQLLQERQSFHLEQLKAAEATAGQAAQIQQQQAQQAPPEPAAINVPGHNQIDPPPIPATMPTGIAPPQ